MTRARFVGGGEGASRHHYSTAGMTRTRQAVRGRGSRARRDLGAPVRCRSLAVAGSPQSPSPPLRFCYPSQAGDRAGPRRQTAMHAATAVARPLPFRVPHGRGLAPASGPSPSTARRTLSLGQTSTVVIVGIKH